MATWLLVVIKKANCICTLKMGTLLVLVYLYNPMNIVALIKNEVLLLFHIIKSIFTVKEE
jgi:hypothetical protein